MNQLYRIFPILNELNTDRKQIILNNLHEFKKQLISYCYLNTPNDIEHVYHLINQYINKQLFSENFYSQIISLELIDIFVSDNKLETIYYNNSKYISYLKMFLLNNKSFLSEEIIIKAKEV